MKQRELLILSIVVFLTIISWLAVDLYNATKSNDPLSKKEMRIPKEIKMNIDKSVFDSLSQKE